MEPFLKLINKSFGTYNIRGIYIEPTYWEAVAIVLLLFMLVFTIARVRFLYVHWNLGKPAFSMFFWGFFLALILEGFLIIGGKTFVTEILGWKNAPKPISTALDLGRAKLVDVLGVKDEISQSVAKEKASYQSVISDYYNLSDEEKKTTRSLICKP